MKVFAVLNFLFKFISKMSQEPLVNYTKTVVAYTVQFTYNDFGLTIIHLQRCFFIGPAKFLSFAGLRVWLQGF